MYTQNIEEDTDSLSRYHYLGGKLFDGLPVLCRLTNIIVQSAIVRSWSFPNIKYGYSKYLKSFCIIEINGELISCPFNMLYVSKNE